jgi:hypothetical protein
MEWVRINNVWFAEDNNISISVRWMKGSWHWRAVYCSGALETAQLAGDNSPDHPYGFINADDAMRAAERWHVTLTSGI